MLTDMTDSTSYPRYRQVVLDTEDARGLAEFYRLLLGYEYLSGSEAPPPGEPDPMGDDWLVLVGVDGRRALAFQQVASLPEATWPEGPRPQMLHLDFSVQDAAALVHQRDRAVALGARILRDDTADPDDALYVFADPSGHPFCIFVLPPEERSPVSG